MLDPHSAYKDALDRGHSQYFEDCVIGCWSAHGEGRFETNLKGSVFYSDSQHNTTSEYPYSPNGSSIAAISSERHLAIMPHPERTFMKYQMAYSRFSSDLKSDYSPWIVMFQNALDWLNTIELYVRV